MAGIDPRYYYLTLGLIVACTLVGLLVAYRWQREVDDDLSPPSDKDLLGPLEKAYYSGLMHKEEYERIKASMARRKGVPEPSPKGRKSGKPKVIEHELPPPLEEEEGESEDGP